MPVIRPDRRGAPVVLDIFKCDMAIL